MTALILLLIAGTILLCVGINKNERSLDELDSRIEELEMTIAELSSAVNPAMGIYDENSF